MQHERLLDAKLDKTAVASTPAPDTDTLSARGAANKRQRQDYLRKQEKAKQPPQLLELAPGSNIYFAPGTWEPDMRKHLLAHAWRQVDDLLLAHAFVVPDPAAPPKLLEFVAALRGGAMISNTFLVCPKQGCAVQYKRLLRLPRYLWISDRCPARFPKEATLLERLLNLERGNTRWRWQTREQMETRRGQSAAGVKERIALVLTSEMRKEDVRNIMGKITMAQFVQKCARSIDTSCVQMGSCGR